MAFTQEVTGNHLVSISGFVILRSDLPLVEAGEVTAAQAATKLEKRGTSYYVDPTVFNTGGPFDEPISPTTSTTVSEPLPGPTTVVSYEDLLAQGLDPVAAMGLALEGTGVSVPSQILDDPGIWELIRRYEGIRSFQDDPSHPFYDVDDPELKALRLASGGWDAVEAGDWATVTAQGEAAKQTYLAEGRTLEDFGAFAGTVLDGAGTGLTDTQLQAARDTELGSGSGITIDPNGQIVDPPPIVPPSNPVSASGPEFGPYTQYINARGLGATGGGPAGAYQRSLYGPTRELYELEGGFDSPLSRLPGAETRTFGDYLLNRDGTPGDIYGRARELLGSLYGLGGAGRTERGLTFGRGFDDDGNAFATDAGGFTGDQQQNLLRLGLRPSLGTVGGPAIAGRLPTEQAIFSQRQSQGTNTATNFLDYLSTKYDLGRFLS